MSNQTLHRAGDICSAHLRQGFALDPIDFNLSETLGVVLALLAPRASERGNKITQNIASDVPEWIFAEERGLRQILLNLIGNAVKFTHAGQIDIDDVFPDFDG